MPTFYNSRCKHSGHFHAFTNICPATDGLFCAVDNALSPVLVPIRQFYHRSKTPLPCTISNLYLSLHPSFQGQLACRDRRVNLSPPFAFGAGVFVARGDGTEIVAMALLRQSQALATIATLVELSRHHVHILWRGDVGVRYDVTTDPVLRRGVNIAQQNRREPWDRIVVGGDAVGLA